MSAAIDPTLRKARSLADSGQNMAAVDLYLGVLDLYPANRRALQGLKAATSVTDPNLAQQLNEAIRTAKELLNQGQSEMALMGMEALITALPHIPELYNELGTMFFALNQGDKAEVAYGQAHKLAPTNPDFAANYATLLGARNQEGRAIAILTPIVAQYSTHLGVHRALARAHLNLGQCVEAIAHFDTVIASLPQDADAYADRATAWFSLGQVDAALTDIRRARTLAPQNIEFIRMYCHMTDVEANDPVVDDIDAALSEPQRSTPDRVRLHFARAGISHALGAHADAFRNWEAANRLYKFDRGYRIERDEELFAHLKTIAPNHAAPLTLPPVTSRRPVFVVGMPRSGTSLLEQMLAAHPQIYGAGELSDFSGALNQVGGWGKAVDQAALTQVRDSYLARVAGKTPDAPWVVDKLPQNFKLIPQIRAALPEARIIHIRRDPMATCWSNFRNFFPSGNASMDFTYDLSDLGRYWLLYDDLMTTWDRLYPGEILTIRYEDLIQDQRRSLTTVLDFIGAPWDEACLHHQDTGRAVMTTSTSQIRQPLYQGSNTAWRVYGKFLGPLQAELAATHARTAPAEAV